MGVKRAIILLLTALICAAQAWDLLQSEVLDVVEELKEENFYTMLNLNNNATNSEIKSTFRRLSLVLHPDKNPSEDAAEKFRNLVAVYEVLKDERKRKYYDEYLVHGYPTWRSPMYYYRRARKVGLVEGTLIAFALLTIGQYLVSWAAYAERFYTLKQLKQKKTKRATLLPSPEDLRKPSILRTLPFQIPYWIFAFIVAIPSMLKTTGMMVSSAVEERMQAHEHVGVEAPQVKRPPQPKNKKKKFEIPEGPTFEASYASATQSGEEVTNGPNQQAPVSGGLWTDDDLDELVQLVKKYPGGTSDRWEIIAECMNRSVPEVTFMANRMRAGGYRRAQQQEEEAAAAVAEQKVKTKTKGGKVGADGMPIEESAWLQVQQAALEAALAKFPKGAAERWDRIAELVPNKTKEECMLRYKYLVEVVRKQKEKKDE